MIRQLLIATLAASLAIASVAAPVGAASDQPEVVFYGGGNGHGIGMSQWGAFGRAEAGHSYQDILAFYYDGTSLGNVDGFGFGSDDVDVLIDIRHSVTVSTPYVGGAPQAGWQVGINAKGVQVATSSTPVTATYANGQWKAMASGSDLCAGKDCGGELSFTVLLAGSHLVLEESEGGNNVGNPANGANGWYSRGRIALHPGALGGGCGDATQFCVIHADLDLQHYLYGIAEVPGSWPAAAQQAQAIAARSYAASAILRRAGNGNVWDLDDSTSDQYYAGLNKEASSAAWKAAVDSTNNQVVVHGGIIAETYYSASNGGHTAEPPDVWAAGSTRPYLKAKADPYDSVAANPYRARDHVYTVADVSRWLNQYTDTISGDQLHVGTIRSIEIDAPPSGRVTFADITINGTKKSTTLAGRGANTAHGFLLYDALVKGCTADGGGCLPLRSTNFAVRSLTNFVDVEYDDYFYVPVQWMTIEELTTGVTPTVFGSEQANTRAQMATFLWRFAGRPAPTAPSGFGDVVPSSFYEKPVSWMKEAGITTGTSPTAFSPNGAVTRAQAATLLWRFAGSPRSTASTPFNDVAGGRYYSEAVRWMVEWDITTGTTPTTFSPNDVLTRGQIATFLWRLAGAPDAFADGVPLPGSMRS